MLSLGQFVRTHRASPRTSSTEPPVAHVDFAEFSRDVLHEILSLHAEFGPLGVIQDGGQRVAFLFSPELNQQVLSDTNLYQTRFFAIRGPKDSAQRRLTGGLLSMNGEQHRRNRRLVKEPFGLRAISTYSDTIVRLADEMLDSWQPGEVRDVAEDMRRYMLQVTSTLLFGLDEPGLALRLGDMIAKWVTMNDELGAGALVPNETFSRHYEELLAYAVKLEAEILQMIRRRRESRKLGRDVLSILVRMHDDEGGLSDEELVGQAAVLFSAAHMTTAHSLSWTLLLLSEHPSVMQRLWDEWQSGDGGGSTTGDDTVPDGAAWSDADSQGGTEESLSLLERVIKELAGSSRLCVLAANQRRSGRAGALPPAAWHRDRIHTVGNAPLAGDLCESATIPAGPLVDAAAVAVCIPSVWRRRADVHRRTTGPGGHAAGIAADTEPLPLERRRGCGHQRPRRIDDAHADPRSADGRS